MKRIILITAVAVSVAIGSIACGTSRAHTTTAVGASKQAPTAYSCPMHPDYHSDHPGDCPICGMHLEPEKKRGAESGTDAKPAPDGAVQVSPERQQAIGIRLGVVGRFAGTK